MFDKLALSKKFPCIVALAAGLYPFLHYYNSNFDMADSWVQLLFLIGICFLLPLTLVLVSPLIFKISFLQKFEKYQLAAINLALFAGLLSLLIFLSHRKTLVLVMFLTALGSMLVYKQLAKIVILQLLLAVMSFFTLIPRLIFVLNYSEDWTKIEEEVSRLHFKSTPNIYVIQPDGYTNFSELRKPPYDYLDTEFENYLADKGFVNYPHFRSNYHSTMTSNASMFAMKHHYLQNTYKGNLKTFGAQEAIVGDRNNALQILRNNGYTNHLITDNSYFTINRKMSLFDFCNVKQKDVKFYDTSGIPEADILPDLDEALRKTTATPNFFFIEKTIPSHVTYEESYSTGIEGERTLYLKRLETADEWVKGLISIIEKHDANPLIILVADHGGYVGLRYTKEVEVKELTELETISVFSSLLAIRWPNNNVPSLNFKSNVNLFLNVFAYLSEDASILNYLEADKSFIPRYDGGSADFYECINENYQVEYIKLDEAKN